MASMITREPAHAAEVAQGGQPGALFPRHHTILTTMYYYVSTTQLLIVLEL